MPSSRYGVDEGLDPDEIDRATHVVGQNGEAELTPNVVQTPCQERSVAHPPLDHTLALRDHRVHSFNMQSTANDRQDTMRLSSGSSPDWKTL